MAKKKTGEARKRGRPEVYTLTHNEMRHYTARYNNGESLAALAEDIGCSIPVVSARLRKAGVEIRPRGRRKPIVAS